mmetsp:Transcript_29610/g.45228  ORF Transcript_29610/g.45228 Transcript_29610/m.45228 type:complete len:230 (+) Transcript_29610:2211-2900(+)
MISLFLLLRRLIQIIHLEVEVEVGERTIGIGGPNEMRSKTMCLIQMSTWRQCHQLLHHRQRAQAQGAQTQNRIDRSKESLVRSHYHRHLLALLKRWKRSQILIRLLINVRIISQGKLAIVSRNRGELQLLVLPVTMQIETCLCRRPMVGIMCRFLQIQEYRHHLPRRVLWNRIENDLLLHQIDPRLLLVFALELGTFVIMMIIASFKRRWKQWSRLILPPRYKRWNMNL